MVQGEYNSILSSTLSSIIRLTSLALPVAAPMKLKNYQRCRRVETATAQLRMNLGTWAKYLETEIGGKAWGDGGRVDLWPVATVEAADESEALNRWIDSFLFSSRSPLARIQFQHRLLDKCCSFQRSNGRRYPIFDFNGPR